jgi:uncharacterized phage protein gp47/JayE
MPYAIPTINELIAQAQGDINSANVTDDAGNTIDGFLEVGIVPVIAAMTLPGFAYEHYGYQSFIALQAVPWTATGEYWAGWAALKGVAQEQATATTGSVTWAGTNGAPLPTGTAVTRSDGLGFTITNGGTVASGSVTVPVVCNTAGAVGNFANGTTFQLGNGIANIAAESTGSTQTTPGADQETFDAFKSRGLAVYAQPPQGGDANDYVEWATAVAGVTRAWVNPNGNGPGTVVVYIMLDVAEAAFGGFPQGTNGVAANETRDAAATGDQLAVANVMYPEEPVTSLVYLCAPTAQPTDFTINNLGSNNTPTTQAAITAALVDMFLRLGNVGGTINPQTRAAWPAIQPSAWYEAIGAIAGLTSFSVGAPSSSITSTAGQLPTLGTVTFNA